MDLGRQRARIPSRRYLKDLLRSPLPPSVSAQISEKLAPKPIDLHYPSIDPLFKGRKTFLDRLHASLTRPDGGAAAIAGRAVHGMGGVGKTRAAVEYAWAHRDDYSALFLLDAETPDKLHSALAALAAPLRLPAAAAPKEVERFEAVLDWLNANPTWLLIFDNIDTEPALAAAHHLLGRLAGGHVLMTSRLTQFPRGVECLDLDVLSLADATSFLLEATETDRRHTPDDAGEARVLAEALGQLALALEMAAATIDARGWSFTKYQEIWQGNRARVVGWARPEITGYHHAVAETWQASVDQLTPAARDLLRRLAFLAPEPVPELLLDVPVPGATTADDPYAALDDLAKYSLARLNPATETFLLHRLILDVTRRGLAQAGAERDRLTEALGWINAAFIGDPQDVRVWKILDPLAAHAEAVAGHADAAGVVEPTVDVMGRLATLFHVKALHPRAEPYYRRALAIAEANFPPNDFRIAAGLNNLAQFLKSTNRLGEAESLMRRGLAIAEASFPPDDPRNLTYLHNLAALLQATNRPREAEPLARRALAIAEANYGPFHPDVAIYLNGLAQLLQATNRFSDAEPLMRRGLAIAEASFPPDDPRNLTYLHNLAALLKDTNRLQEAESLMCRGLAIAEASYGPDHPRVATRLNSLAQLLHATNRFSDAEPLMRRGLAIEEASYGPDHPRVAGQLNNLTCLLLDTNRLSEAEPLIRRALTIDEASHGPDHLDIARDLNNLARLLQATNRLDEAEPLLRRVLGIFLAFQRDTGHAHRFRDPATDAYSGLLAAMGKTEAEINATLVALGREVGLNYIRTAEGPPAKRPMPS